MKLLSLYLNSVNEIVKFDPRLKCYKKRWATELTESNKHVGAVWAIKTVTVINYLHTILRTWYKLLLANNNFVINNL